MMQHLQAESPDYTVLRREKQGEHCELAVQAAFLTRYVCCCSLETQALTKPHLILQVQTLRHAQTHSKDL